MSYGPYWNVPSGNYDIKIEGINIPDEVEITIYYNHGGNYCDFTTLSRDASVIDLNLELIEDVSDLEILIKNNSSDSVTVKSITLTSNEWGGCRNEKMYISYNTML